MNQKLKVNSDWLQKACILWAFIGLLSAREARAIGLPPVILVPPLGTTVQSGDTATFTATIDASQSPLTITWRINGTGKTIPNATVSNVAGLLGTTISTLTITNVTTNMAGNYSVKVVNANGQVTSGDALLIVLSPTNLVTTVSILTQGTGITNGGFHMQLHKPATSNCVIDATSDFITWTPVYTNSTSSTNVSYLDGAATNLPFRYYRARLQ